MYKLRSRQFVDGYTNKTYRAVILFTGYKKNNDRSIDHETRSIEKQQHV